MAFLYILFVVDFFPQVPCPVPLPTSCWSPYSSIPTSCFHVKYILQLFIPTPIHHFPSHGPLLTLLATFSLTASPWYTVCTEEKTFGLFHLAQWSLVLSIFRQMSWFHSPLWLNKISWCTWTAIFFLSVDGCLGYFYFFSIVDGEAINMMCIYLCGMLA